MKFEMCSLLKMVTKLSQTGQDITTAIAKTGLGFQLTIITFPCSSRLRRTEAHCDHIDDGLAERSKALDLGSSPKGRGFKSHSRQCIISGLNIFAIRNHV